MDMQKLKERIEALSHKFLGTQMKAEKADPLGFTPDLELIAAFRLLAHAEIETFLEERAKAGLAHAKRSSGKYGDRLCILMSLAGNLNRRADLTKIQKQEDFFVLRDSLVQAAEKSISENNGIKRDSFLSLNLYSGNSNIGIDETLLSELDSFGSSRGDVAHKPIGRVATIQAPSDENEAALRLLRLLEQYCKPVRTSRSPITLMRQRRRLQKVTKR
jgi:hypothetical protein